MSLQRQPQGVQATRPLSYVVWSWHSGRCRLQGDTNSHKLSSGFQGTLSKAPLRGPRLVFWKLFLF